MIHRWRSRSPCGRVPAKRDSYSNDEYGELLESRWSVGRGDDGVVQSDGWSGGVGDLDRVEERMNEMIAEWEVKREIPKQDN